MKAEHVSFGRITINNACYTKDLWIINGKISERDKSIAEKKYGTSHIIGVTELKKVITSETKILMIGAGVYGGAKLNDDAEKFIKDKGLELHIKKTGEIIHYLNSVEDEKKISGIIHLTC